MTLTNEKNNNLQFPIKRYMLLGASIFVYSLSGLFSKLASSYVFLSYPYILCLIGVVGVLGCYAVLWQVALKKIPLSRAYPFRSLSIVFGLAIAFFAFHEIVTWQNFIGCFIVIVGLLIITTGR